jgi:hypothetical protein
MRTHSLANEHWYQSRGQLIKSARSALLLNYSSRIQQNGGSSNGETTKKLMWTLRMDEDHEVENLDPCMNQIPVDLEMIRQEE